MFSVISLLAIFNKRIQNLNKIKESNTEEETNKMLVHNEIVLKNEETIIKQRLRNQNEKDVNIKKV